MIEREAEVSGIQLPSPSTIPSTAQSSSVENQPSEDLDPDTEEALRKKGRLLLQHLQNLDARLSLNNPGSSAPPFTPLSLPRNFLSMQGTRHTSIFTPPQSQGQNLPQTVSTSGLLPENNTLK